MEAYKEAVVLNINSTIIIVESGAVTLESFLHNVIIAGNLVRVIRKDITWKRDNVFI